MVKEKTEKEIEIISPDKIERDLSKPVTFRCDPESYSKLITLEKARDESKAEVIKRAVNESFEILILRHINARIFDVIVQVFGKPNHLTVYLENITPRTMSNEEDIINPFVEGNNSGNKSFAIYKIKEENFISRDEHIEFRLDHFSFELSIEPNDMLKIRFETKDIIKGEISKFKPEIYFKILEIITKPGFKTETDSEKKDTSLNFFFERTAPLVSCRGWVVKLKGDLEKVREVFKNLSGYLESQKEIKKLDNKSSKRSIH